MDASKKEVIPRVSHYGTIHIGDINIDCVILDNADHTRGYIQRQLVQALGFTGQIRNLQILNLIGDFAPNALSLIAKSEYSKVSLPHGGLAKFFPAGVLPDVVSGILDAAGTKLHQWLQDGGLSLLEKQINAVTMIARSSIDRDDFRARCAAAFMNREQQRMFFNGGAA